MKKRKQFLIIKYFTLALTVSLITGCFPARDESASLNFEISELGLPPGPGVGSGALVLLTQTNILATYASLTGVLVTPRISATNLLVRDALPVLGIESELSGPAIMGIYALASEFCIELINTEAALQPNQRNFMYSIKHTVRETYKLRERNTHGERFKH